MNSIFEYTNYRTFLRDYYNHKKEHTKYFSFRYFSQKAGFSSPSWLKFIINGERNLTSESLEKFLTALDLNKKEKDYFRALVAFNQAKTEKEKQHSFQQLMACAGKGKFARITADQFSFYSTWYHVAVLQLIDTVEFKNDPKWIATKLKPSVAVPEIKKSIHLLNRLGFIEEKNGTLALTNKILTTDDDVQSMMVRRFHKEMIRLAGESLDHVNPSNREASSLTVSVSKDTFERLRIRIREFEEELLHTIEQDSPQATTVYQLNFQLFPLTETTHED